MDFMGSTHTGKGKKPTTLIISIKFDNKRRARNIRLCLIDFLCCDLKLRRSLIKTKLEDSGKK